MPSLAVISLTFSGYALTQTQSPILTATPAGASLGAGDVIAGIELSVARGLTHGDIFGVFVAVQESNGTDHGTCEVLLSETTVFGESGSQASVGMIWNDAVACPNAG